MAAAAAAAATSKNNAEMQQFQELQQQIELQRLQQSQQMFLQQQRLQEIQVIIYFFFDKSLLSLFQEKTYSLSLGIFFDVILKSVDGLETILRKMWRIMAVEKKEAKMIFFILKKWFLKNYFSVYF